QRLMRDVWAGREPSRTRKRDGSRPRHHSVDAETPVSKSAGPQALIGVIVRRRTVDRNHFRDLAAVKLASKEMVRHQEPLRGICQCFANTKDAAIIRRYQRVSIGEPPSNSKARNACGDCQATGDQLTTRELIAHACSFRTAAFPLIIAPTRLRKPARQTIAMWTT